MTYSHLAILTRTPSCLTPLAEKKSIKTFNSFDQKGTNLSTYNKISEFYISNLIIMYVISLNRRRDHEIVVIPWKFLVQRHSPDLSYLILLVWDSTKSYIFFFLINKNFKIRQNPPKSIKRLNQKTSDQNKIKFVNRQKYFRIIYQLW